MDRFFQEMEDSIQRHSPEIRGIASLLFNNPETGLKEFKAFEAQTAFLSKNGFRLEAPYGSLETAYKASFGNGSPVFCIMSEYDALPEIGHACGHHLICSSALASGLALKEIMEKHSIPGTIVVMGTPGEEGYAGKVIMIKEGAFKGIDAAIISHPFDKTITDPGCLSVSRFLAKFHGKASHAAMAPEEGINALDSVIQLFNSVSAWRQQLPESSRIHGIITHGGTAPNIIPEYAEAFFYIRADNMKTHLEMEKRFAEIASAAALSSGARLELERLSAYKSSVYCKALNEEFLNSAAKAGLAPERHSKGGRGSSDFGDVSHVIPAANFHFDITGKACPLHSLEFKEFASTEAAFGTTMKMALAMASIGLRFFTDESFRKQL